jgi:hypothetical protein
MKCSQREVQDISLEFWNPVSQYGHAFLSLSLIFDSVNTIFVSGKNVTFLGQVCLTASTKVQILCRWICNNCSLGLIGWC